MKTGLITLIAVVLFAASGCGNVEPSDPLSDWALTATALPTFTPAPTFTPRPPTATPVPPTATPVPPTATPVPPTAEPTTTATPSPTPTSSIDLIATTLVHDDLLTDTPPRIFALRCVNTIEEYAEYEQALTDKFGPEGDKIRDAYCEIASAMVREGMIELLTSALEIMLSAVREDSGLAPILPDEGLRGMAVERAANMDEANPRGDNPLANTPPYQITCDDGGATGGDHIFWWNTGAIGIGPKFNTEEFTVSLAMSLIDSELSAYIFDPDARSIGIGAAETEGGKFRWVAFTSACDPE